MPNYIQTGGYNSIYSSTGTTAGTWIPVHPRIRNITLQALHTGTSVGTTLSSVINIEASQDGTNALATKLGTITISSVGSPASDGFSIDAHWNYIRVNVASLSTGTIAVLASAQVPA